MPVLVLVMLLTLLTAGVGLSTVFAVGFRASDSVVRFWTAWTVAFAALTLILLALYGITGDSLGCVYAGPMCDSQVEALD